MIRTVLRTTLVAGLLPMVAFAGDKKSEAMVRLAKAHIAIVKGDQQKALDHLNWCYDNSVNANSKAFGIRGYVIETMGDLAKTFAPARQGLKARRDTATASLDTPPKIVPTFFDVLAINRALGDSGRNKSLLAQVQKAGFKKFAARPQGPTPVSTTCDDCNDRIRTTYAIQRVQNATDALFTIATSKSLSDLERASLVEEENDMLDELTDLQEALVQASTIKEQASLLRRISFVTQELEDFIRPQEDCRWQEMKYYVALSEHVSQFSDSDSFGTGK